MSYADQNGPYDEPDVTPGDENRSGNEIGIGLKGDLIGLGLSVLLTAISFWIVHTTLVWAPAVPVALIVFAIAQMGVHLVFFLHITTAPDNTNNVLALAFGVLIVALVIGGSLWIMWNLNSRLMPMSGVMEMQH
jgi:cytochrome o ubiquinol oxidase operon protein cyoD